MQRNVTLDYFKLLLCVLVISIHEAPIFTNSLSPFLYYYGVCRIAVPCFFIINGYFLFSKIDDFKSIKKYVIRLLLVFATWQIIYMPWCSWVDFKYFIVHQVCIGYYHLWYVSSLIRAVIIFYILKRFFSDKILLILGIILFLIGFYMKYLDLDVIFFRNGLFFAFPFVFCGYFIRKHREIFFKINDLYYYLIILIGTIMLVVELCHIYGIMFETGTRIYCDNTIGLLLICPVLLVLLLKYSKYEQSTDVYMSELSSAIYYVHPLVITLLGGLPIAHQSLFELPVVFLLSLIFSSAIININKRMKVII